jgi:hypothetical protein
MIVIYVLRSAQNARREIKNEEGALNKLFRTEAVRNNTPMLILRHFLACSGIARKCQDNETADPCQHLQELGEAHLP